MKTLGNTGKQETPKILQKSSNGIMKPQPIKTIQSSSVVPNNIIMGGGNIPPPPPMHQTMHITPHQAVIQHQQIQLQQQQHMQHQMQLQHQQEQLNNLYEAQLHATPPPPPQHQTIPTSIHQQHQTQPTSSVVQLGSPGSLYSSAVGVASMYGAVQQQYSPGQFTGGSSTSAHQIFFPGCSEPTPASALQDHRNSAIFNSFQPNR